MALAPTYRRRLYERALDQYGYVTTRDAVEIGVPPGELRKLSERGGLEHVGYGLYRFEDIPRTSRDQFMEAVLLVGRDAYLQGDAVLALHNLALANPRQIRVATPRRNRRKHPDFMTVERRSLSADELTHYEGIPATTIARALLDCRGVIMEERLIEAAKEAARTGLLRRRDDYRAVSKKDRWLWCSSGPMERVKTQEARRALGSDENRRHADVPTMNGASPRNSSAASTAGADALRPSAARCARACSDLADPS